MRIAHTYPYSAPIDDNVPRLASDMVTGGGETYPYRLSLQQSKDGHRVTFFTAKQPGIKRSHIVKGNWEIRYLTSIKPLSVQYAFSPLLPFRLLLGGYDAYFSHQLPTITTTITGIVAKLRGKPFFVQYLGFRPDINKSAVILTKINAKLVTKVIFPNQYAADFFKNYLRPEQTVVIRYGIDLGFYKKSASLRRPKVMADTKYKYLLFVGRLLPSKGIDILIKAHQALTKKHRNIKTVIVGKGPFREYLEKIIKRQGLTSQVLIAGFVSDEELLNYYNSADVFVLPSTYYDYKGNYHPEPEAFGLVLAEAMNLGIPVVASRVGGIPEWIENGVNGLLFESVDWLDLTKSIDKLLSDVNLSHKIVLHAKNVLKQRHSLAKISEQIESELIKG